ncbi:MAG: hypothetical protein LPK85_05700, partial [Gammaproteobacteria bacterium]|nr:hypothetical protein [Gammaproteobacteria bacterium]
MKPLLSRLGLPHPVLRLQESMSGWIHLDGRQQDFHLTLDATGDTLVPLDTPMPFAGYARVGDDSYPAQGTLTLTLSGPIYAFRIFRPGQPTLDCTGHKTYAIQHLRVSLTTCPLQVREQDRLVGGA